MAFFQNIAMTPRLLYLANHFSNISRLVDPTNRNVIETFNDFELGDNDPNIAVENIYGFVSSFDYVLDELSDNWQRPSETLNIRQGDCEDLSVLMSSFFELNGLQRNFFVLTYNVNWREYHVANLVYIPQTTFKGDSWIYLDASYPHVIGSLPFYSMEAQVFGFFSKKNQFSNPLLASFPQPITLFIENAGFNQFLGMQ